MATWRLDDAHADGRVAVANGWQEVLYFHEAGALVSRVGSRGSGPGEFERLVSLTHPDPRAPLRAPAGVEGG